MCDSIEAARKLALYFKGACCSPLFEFYIAVIDTRWLANSIDEMFWVSFPDSHQYAPSLFSHTLSRSIRLSSAINSLSKNIDRGFAIADYANALKAAGDAAETAAVAAALAAASRSADFVATAESTATIGACTPAATGTGTATAATVAVTPPAIRVTTAANAATDVSSAVALPQAASHQAAAGKRGSITGKSAGSVPPPPLPKHGASSSSSSSSPAPATEAQAVKVALNVPAANQEAVVHSESPTNAAAEPSSYIVSLKKRISASGVGMLMGGMPGLGGASGGLADALARRRASNVAEAHAGAEESHAVDAEIDTVPPSPSRSPPPLFASATSSLPSSGKCSQCDCETFVAHTFKKNQCNLCYHPEH